MLRPHAQGGQSLRQCCLDLLRGLVVVVAHQNYILQHRAGLDPAADADHGVVDLRVHDDAAVGNHGAGQPAAHDLAGRQVAGVGVNRRLRVEEIELRQLMAEIEIRVEKGADRSDVLPIALVDVGEKSPARNQVGDDVLAEIDLLTRKSPGQHLAVEDVNTHRGQEKILAARIVQPGEDRLLHLQRLKQRRVLRLFLEARDALPGRRSPGYRTPPCRRVAPGSSPP